MPTGYTESIKDGISFKTFVLRCARAMNALVMMRDDPYDAPIPDKFEPTDYYIREIKRIKKELNEIENMSDKQIEKRCNLERNKEIKNAKKYIQESNDLEKKYRKMLKKVHNWVSPQNYSAFKKFMIDQINDSIKFDCSQSYWQEILNKPVLSSKEWKEQKIHQLKSDLNYHTIENERDIERTNERNLWIKQLRDSLKGYKE